MEREKPLLAMEAIVVCGVAGDPIRELRGRLRPGRLEVDSAKSSRESEQLVIIEAVQRPRDVETEDAARVAFTAATPVVPLLALEAAEAVEPAGGHLFANVQVVL